MTTPLQIRPARPVNTGPEIIDFVAFRCAIPAAAPAPRDGADDGVVLQFPLPARRRVRARPGAAAGISDLSAACALLVERFNAMQVAVTDLQDSCRALDEHPDQVADQAGAMLLGIAALSRSTEQFQHQLDTTIDTAFR
jgi:hypothetical protein